MYPGIGSTGRLKEDRESDRGGYDQRVPSYAHCSSNSSDRLKITGPKNYYQRRAITGSALRSDVQGPTAPGQDRSVVHREKALTPEVVAPALARIQVSITR
jgi:hypothetical protein